MHRFDYLILAFYLAGFVLLGLFLARKNKTSEDMFSAGGQSPWWISGLSAFMTMFSAGTFVVWGGIAYKYGLVAVVINLCYGVAALLAGFFVAGRWKRSGVKTPAQFIELRFGPGAVRFYTWAMMVFRITGVAVSLYSLAVVLVATMPLAEGNPLRDPATGNLSLVWAVLIFGAVVVLYTMAGGLWAVLMTDVLQFIVLNLAVLFVVPLALHQVGGVGAFIERAPEGFFALTTSSYTWFFMAGWVLIHFFMIGAEWAFAQRFLCVPTERDSRWSTYLFGGLYLVSPLIWLMPPMLYRVIDPNADPEQAYILSCKSVLPVGMVGLMVAAMFSATASMVSSQLNVFAGALNDSFRKMIAGRSGDERAAVRSGRFFTVLLGAVLIVLALAIPYLGGAEKLIVSITSLMVGPLLAPSIWGLLSRRITIRAVWITAGISFALGLVAKLGLGTGGWLVNDTTRGLSNWIAGNSVTVDLIVGVLVPVLVLLILHQTHRSTAPGWLRVEVLARDTQSRGVVTRASDLPAIIVSIALLACALPMFALAVVADKDRGLLGAFGATLVLISGMVGASVAMKRRKENKA